MGDGCCATELLAPLRGLPTAVSSFAGTAARDAVVHDVCGAALCDADAAVEASQFVVDKS